MRSPNEEQKLAIEHKGGVLLKAGAGSGKTFVLVEHLVYLVKSFNDDKSNLSLLDYEKTLRVYFSKIVLMTFTRKAAGEIALRLQKRFYEEQQNGGEKWEIAKDALSSLNISTIHGFCNKVLTSGVIPDFDPSIDLIGDVEISNKIEKLYKEWFSRNINRIQSSENGELYLSVLTNKSIVIDSMISIFTDPTLRDMWANTKNILEGGADLKGFFKKYNELSGFDELFDDTFSINAYVEHKSKKWYKYLEEFQEIRNNVELGTKESIEIIIALFIKHKGVRKPIKSSGLNEVISFCDKLSEFKKFIQKNEQSLVSFLEGKKEFVEWGSILKDIFDFIEDNYKFYSGTTFADLEYYVLKGLQNEETCERVQKLFSYFIIDEFQDTSEVQFSILKKIIGNDFKKLFCVGDLKQAIYGFRGGELGVFKACEDVIPLALTMTNNYRSKEQIVQINNLLFENIFKKGVGYEGHDSSYVHVDYQSSPNKSDDKGLLSKNNVSINAHGSDSKQRVSSAEINYIESTAIVKKIENFIEIYPGEQICVLYRKLGPSVFLIPQLIDKKIAFTAQIKIPMSEDPIVGIFKILLEYYFEYRKINDHTDKDFNKIVHYVEVVLNTYMNYLNMSSFKFNLSKVGLFYKDCFILGVREAFRKFIFSCNISNSNYKHNMGPVESICELANNDIDKIWGILDLSIDEKYSIDFQFGNNPAQLIVMTGHASKGLEFDHVIMGGIHTNGIDIAMKSYIGKMPLSYRWKVGVQKKDVLKSPYYLLESIITKKKEFAESKRLFYVVCTRAVKSLSWVDISFNGKPLLSGKNSWINAIRSWENDVEQKSQFVREHIKSFETHSEVRKVTDDEELSQLTNNPPLFHKDNLGILDKDEYCNVADDLCLGTLSELSVTRLATITQCPRKFYLQNICKIDDELELIDEIFECDSISISVALSDEKYKNTDDREASIDLSTKIKSSAERGTALHRHISKMLENNFEVPAYVTETDDIKILNWIKDLLEVKKEKFSLQSEVSLKFSFFGHMVSAIPDLLVIPKSSEEKFSVWDFKTGDIDPSNEKSYWFQLMSYSMAVYDLGYLQKNHPICLVLCYLDKSEVLEREITYLEIKDFLYIEWKKLSDLGCTDQSHCLLCAYRNICHF